MRGLSLRGGQRALPLTPLASRLSAIRPCSASSEQRDGQAANRTARPRTSGGRPAGRRGRQQPAQEQEHDMASLLGLDANGMQEQIAAMQQVFSKMSEEEQRAFVQTLQQQEALLAQRADAAPGSQAGLGEAPPSPFMDASTWKKSQLYPKLWELVVRSLSAEDAEVLRKAFPEDWAGYGRLGRSQVSQGLRRLTRSERERLPAILEYIESLQQGVGALAEIRALTLRRAAVRRRRMAAQRGMELSEDDDDAAEADAADPLLELLGWQQPEGAREGTASGASGATSSSGSSSAGAPASWGSTWAPGGGSARQQSHAATRTPGYAPAAAAVGAEEQEPLEYFDRQQQPGASASGIPDGLPRAVQERVGRMLGTYERYVEGQGWSQEQQMRESREMRNLIRLYEDLSDLATRLANEASAPGTAAAAGMGFGPNPVQELERRMADMAEELQLVIAGKASLKDPAARAVVRYIETQMLSPDEDGGMLFDCEVPSLGRLGQFIVAAQNWEAYRAFMHMYASKHPELELQPTMEAAGMSDGEDWWVKLDPLDGGVDDGGADDSLREGHSCKVDLARVETIAGLDVDNLHFMAELEATGYSEETFMKWYFHPVMGPRIRSGAFLDPSQAGGSANPAAMLQSLLQLAPGSATPELLQQAMEEAWAEAGLGEAGVGMGMGSGSAAGGAWQSASARAAPARDGDGDGGAGGGQPSRRRPAASRTTR